MSSKAYLGAVGNGETVALISPDGEICWLCVPRPDSFPVFARALDPRQGGSLRLTFRWGDTALRTPMIKAQRYLGRTNILETSLLMDDLSAVIVDYMPWGQRHLIRQITLTNLSEERRGVAVDVGVRATCSDAAPRDLRDRVHAAFRGPQAALLSPDESLTTTLVLAYGDTPTEALRNWVAAGDGNLEEEERFWERWLGEARPVRSGDRALDVAYCRSLLALKLLCNEKTGAILAAPTASFPAIPGGGDNWDYRYAWLRDGYFIARCLDAAGLHGESRRFYQFALKHQDEDGRWRQTLYTMDGRNPLEFTVNDLAGPNGEVPVRFGNAASTQIQIDSEGSVLHGLWCHWKATGDTAFIRGAWDHISRAAGMIMASWQWPENGVWEIRERRDHWVYGKAICCAGLLAAAGMAAALGFAAEAARWDREAARIRQDVLKGGWSEERQAFLQTYDPRSPLDVSVLALSLWGLLPADDPHMRSTVAAIEEPFWLPAVPDDGAYSTDTPYWGVRCGGLNMWGGMARYDYAAVPFYLPTLWLARHHLRAGNRDRALELVRTCLMSATDLGLMAEHFDPRTGEQWGNFPQGFSHEELALCLLELFGTPAYAQ
ncbi:MAG TPA: glycoside hydrolase family 15 protein [Symbiobacteriaceae bacterium]|nr:glycoside hydrolase family 15 protein [Symbiobacteriaceae bacterium]